MEAPVKVIHRDLKSRNGNVVLSFYFAYFIMKYIHLVVEIGSCFSYLLYPDVLTHH